MSQNRESETYDGMDDLLKTVDGFNVDRAGTVQIRRTGAILTGLDIKKRQQAVLEEMHEQLESLQKQAAFQAGEPMYLLDGKFNPIRFGLLMEDLHRRSTKMAELYGMWAALERLRE